MVMTKTASRPNGAREPLVQAADTLARAVTASTTRPLPALRLLRDVEGAGQGRALGMALGSLPEDLTSLASLYQGPERREVATRCRSAAERMLALAEPDSVESASRGAAGRRGERMGEGNGRWRGAEHPLWVLTVRGSADKRSGVPVASSFGLM